MTASGLSAARLTRLRDVLTRHVDRGEVPGLVAAVARRGAVHVEALGTMEARHATPTPSVPEPRGTTEAPSTGEGTGDRPMTPDAIFRLASVSKIIAATAAMVLVEECRLRLDDPVGDLLPELAAPRVLADPDGPLTETVPARRPITLHDLLTFRLGTGALLRRGPNPLVRALAEAGLTPIPQNPPTTSEDFLKRLGGLPLAFQPGEKWLYHTGADVLGVLMARAVGRPLPELLQERLFDPLGMVDTGFHVPADKLGRLPAAYRPGQAHDGLVRTDGAGTDRTRFATPPTFPSAAAGMVSTAADLLTLGTMLLRRGRHTTATGGSVRILARPTVEAMTTDQLTAEQRAENGLFFRGVSSWGLGVNVVTARTDPAGSPGTFGWTGGTGTALYIDPAEDLVGVLLTQRGMTSPRRPAVMRDFWTCVYQAIDD